MNLKGRKILVTGGAGFLGSHISMGLVEAGAETVILDPMLSGRNVNLEVLGSRVKFYKGDICDRKVLAQAFEGVDTVIHTAFPMAICDRDLEKQYVDIGSVGIFNVLREAYEHKALFIYASSISVYGEQKYTPIDEEHPLDPILIYGATKLAGEYYTRVMARSYGLKTVILRYTDVYGPRNGRYSAPIQFMHRALAGEPIIIQGSGTQARSYTYIADIVEGTLLAAAHPAAIGDTFNLAGDDCVSILELAEKIVGLTNSSSEIRCDYSLAGDQRKYLIDNKKIKEILSFKPGWDIDRGLAETLAWAKTVGPEFFLG